ncbi:hypothetical protein [Nonomuraea sp. NPDC049480]|uniref:NucA/NucB deoxyribonuclease domain-containing protein n=1 Tax=Nonomuraea sp. NPDC049480 TaxID=3364353 RepID=UPI0037A95ACD
MAKVPEGKNVVCIASQGPASEISPRLANALPRPAEIPEWCQDATHWEFNRTQACRHWVYNVLMIDTRGKVIGTLELDTWDMVVTTPNAERMTWEQWLHPQFPTGGPWTGMTWTANGDCVGLCAMQTTNVTVPVDFGARWTRAYHWFVDTLGSTIGQKAKISLDVEHVFYVPGTFPVDMSDAVQLVEDIRCDYRSAGTNAYHGCVFPGYRPIMRVPKTTMPQFAQHIADAQSTNWPIGAPGNVPLSRLTNKADIKENRTQSCQYAPSPRPPDPATGERQECDEYPFASTHEGSYTSGFDASWRLIRESQNLAGANLLQSTYDQNRILNKDEFWVQVVTI